MTRGYVCVVEGRKVAKYAYLNSDAYLSGYGLEILQSVTNGTLDEWLENQIQNNHMMYGDKEPDPRFSLNWIRKSKETKEWRDSDYCEYGYIYIPKTGVLKVYNYGKLLCVITPECRDKYLYYFDREVKLLSAICYDDSKLALDFEREKPFIKSIAQMSLHELEKYDELSDNMQDLPLLSDIHLLDVWHRADRPAYLKRLSTIAEQSTTELDFVVSKECGNKWDVTKLGRESPRACPWVSVRKI